MKQVIVCLLLMGWSGICSGGISFLHGKEGRYEIQWEQRADMPEARRNLKAVALGNRIYAMGGYAQPHRGLENALFCYDIKTDAWSTRSPMPTPRSNFAVAVVEGKVYAIGGDKFLDKGETYDPGTDTWTVLPPMPTARQHINCAVTGRHIHVPGGRISHSREPDESLTGVHEVYDVRSRSWQTLTPFPAKIDNPSVSAVEGKLYALNRMNGSLRMFDPHKGEWIKKKGNPSVHFPSGSVVLEGKIFVLDGVRPGENVSRLFVYDPATNTWEETTPLPVGIKLCGFAAAEGRLYVIGGCDQQFVASPRAFVGIPGAL